MSMYFEEAGHAASQMSRIFQKVVNNVSIDIRGLHVRYEEHVCSSRDKCHVVGLNVQRLVSFATNSEWKKEFAPQQTGSLRRVVEMENVNVYCEANSPSVIRPSELDGMKCKISGLETMKRMDAIEKESNIASSKTLQWWDSASPRAHHYLISPLSAVSFQFTSTIMDPTNVIERRTQGSVSCNMKSDPAAILLDTEQVCILKHILSNVHTYTTWQHVIRKQQHFKMLSEITDAESAEFYKLVRKKMLQPSSMKTEEKERLEELQEIFPLYRLTSLRKRGLESTVPLEVEDTPKEVSVVFEEGSLGMDIESNPQKFGHRGVRVNACVPDSQADKSGVIQPGCIIMKIGSVATDDLKYDEVLNLLKSSARPLNVVFRTAPKESMLTHHDLDKDIPPQHFTITATIESFSLSLVASDVRREVIRIFGSGLRANVVAQLSSMGVVTSIHGSVTTKTIQCSDRWNSSMTFESQCIASVCGYDMEEVAAEIAFDIPLVPSKNAIAVETDRKLGCNGQYQTQNGGYARLSSRISVQRHPSVANLDEPDAISYPHIFLTFGHADMRIIIEHWDKLLQCLDTQTKRIEDYSLEIANNAGPGFPTVQQLTRSTSIDLAHGEIETDLGVELLPSPVATILSGMFTGPASTTPITFARFQSTVFADFLICRFLRKDSRLKAEYENAIALRALRLHCVTSDNGAFLNLVESSLHACTSWGVGPKQSDLEPRFAFGYVSEDHQIGKSFDEEANYIENIVVPVDECLAEIPQLSLAARLSQNAERPHYNNVALAAAVSNMEIRALEVGTDVMSIFDILTPISQYASLIPVKPPQAKYFNFTDITLNTSAVSIVLTDRPESKNQLFGYQVNGELRYSSSEEGEECAVVEAGPLWIGLYDMENETACQPEKTQLIYNRFNTENETFDHKFTITKSKCKPSDSGCAAIPTVNDNKGSWAPMPAVMLQRLFEQLQCDVELHWPNTSNGPAALHECISNLIMSNPNPMIDQTAWSLGSRSSITDSSLASYATAAQAGNVFDVINLSNVVYRSNPAGDAYLPTIINNTDILEAVCQRNQVVFCALFENPDKDVYWKCRDIEVLARYCTELSSLRITGAQLHSFEDLTTTRLREITLTRCDISNEAIEQLIAASPKLVSLTLVDVASLTNFEIRSKTLERLTMRECMNIRDNVISQVLRDSPAIKYLNMDGCRQFRHVTFQSASLQELNVSRCSSLEDTAITSACTGCPELQTLDCTWCYQLVDPRIIGHSLKSVSVYRCTGLSDAVLTRLFSENSLLVHVNMSGVRRIATRKTLTYPSEPQDLFHRWFCSRKKTTLEVARFMISSKSLRTLYLDDCTALNDEDVTLLSARCPRLELLSMNFCTDLVNPVVVSDSLISIAARYSEKLSTHAVEVMLTNCPKLKTVDLQGCQTVDAAQLHPNSSQHLNTMACAPYQLKKRIAQDQLIDIKIESS